MGRVDGKVALVTGAASGIGRATAQVLAAEGARVMVTDVNESDGQTVTEAIGESARFLALDVTEELQWEDAISQSLAAFGGLDIVVNNAGIAHISPLEDTTLDDWRRVMAVNLEGTFLGVKHGIRAMKERGGSIINVSSAGGIVGSPMIAGYNASKGGVRLLTKCAALECAQLGYQIRVNSVHPGAIDTPPVVGIMQSVAGVDADTAREMVSKMQPVGRMGEPIEIAYGILFLASDESLFMTGSEFVIDGGMTAQ